LPDYARFIQNMKNMPNYAKNLFGKIGHKVFCQRHQNYARFSKFGKNYAKLATLSVDIP